MKSRSLLTRMESVQTPVIPLVGQLIANNPGTISLGQGIAFYGPPPGVISSLAHCFEDSSNHQYKSVQGIPPLLKAIAVKLNQDNQITIDKNKNAIVVTAGANMAFLQAVLAITLPGDEIILNSPYYFNNEMAIRIAGCEPITVPTDEQYQLQIEKIAAAITSKTKAIVTISPNNPTGAVYPQFDLEKINQLCAQKEIYHISDEAYEYFTYDEINHFSPASLGNSESHTISLFSLSKSYGFAGWRVGYMVVPAHLLLAIKKIQDTNLICPPIVCQYAAIAALEAGSDYCQQFLPEIKQNRQTLLSALSELSCLDNLVIPQGAFYYFIRVNHSGKDMELVKKLIENYHVAVLPGSTFGIEEGCYLRIAYGALRTDTATIGIERLQRGLKTLT